RVRVEYANGSRKPCNHVYSFQYYYLSEYVVNTSPGDQRQACAGCSSSCGRRTVRRAMASRCWEARASTAANLVGRAKEGRDVCAASRGMAPPIGRPG